MHRFLLLPVASVFLLAGCHTTEPAASSEIGMAYQPSPAQTLDIRAEIDGSDELRITSAGLEWRHRQWEAPSNILINGRRWDLNAGPMSMKDARLSLAPADFRHLSVQVTARTGRDTIAVESAPDHVSVYFADTPNGPAPYHVRLHLVPIASVTH